MNRVTAAKLESAQELHEELQQAVKLKSHAKATSLAIKLGGVSAAKNALETVG